MPTYSYQCTRCDHSFDSFHGISAAGPECCPQDGCGGELRRLIGGGSGMILKGTGYYVTDFKNKSAGCAGSGDCGSCPSGS